MDCQSLRIRWWIQQIQSPKTNGDLDWQKHIQNCDDCAQWEKQEQQFDDDVHALMKAVPIPAGLQERIISQLHQSSKMKRKRFNGLHRTLAAAALFVFVIWLAFYLDMFWGDHASLDLNGIDRWARDRWVNPLSLSQTDVIREVENYFKLQHRLTVKLPPELTRYWDFRNLTECFVQSFKGRNVAVLEFRAGSSHALVMLLHHELVDGHEGIHYYQGEVKGTYLLVPSPNEGNMVFIVLKSGTPDDFRLRESAS